MLAAPPNAALPAPEALTGLLDRLADPTVPGTDKVNLVEAATPETAANLDKFSNALRDGGYLPMTITATNIAWSDKNPSDASATISVKTARPNTGVFTFPMEFAPFKGGWQLSRGTAEMLLALRNPPAGPPPAATPPPSPAPNPSSTAAPSPSPSATPTEAPSPAKMQAPRPTRAPSPAPTDAPSPTPSDAPNSEPGPPPPEAPNPHPSE